MDNFILLHHRVSYFWHHWEIYPIRIQEQNPYNYNRQISVMIYGSSLFSWWKIFLPWNTSICECLLAYQFSQYEHKYDILLADFRERARHVVIPDSLSRKAVIWQQCEMSLPWILLRKKCEMGKIVVTLAVTSIYLPNDTSFKTTQIRKNDE